MKNEPFATTAAIAFLICCILGIVGVIWDIWGTPPAFLFKLFLTSVVIFLAGILGYWIYERDDQ